MPGSPAADVPAPRLAGVLGGHPTAEGDEGLRPYGLRCEHRVAPLGIDEPTPLLSWRLSSGRRGDGPAAYRVRVAEEAGGEALWDTGRVQDADAIGVVYAGPALRPRTRYHWRVEVWSAGSPAPAEAGSWFETGMTDSAWRAAWITHDPDPIPVMDAPIEGERALDNHGLAPCPVLRRTFTLPVGTRRARLYVSARGLYDIRVNGTRVGDAELAPGWTDYTRRVQYQTYDVTDLLQDGENALAATIADGWWSGFVGFEPRRAGAHYGSFPQLLAELRITGPDGTTTTIATDDTWRTATGAVRHADLLMGECHDLRHEAGGWQHPGFDDARWSQAVVTDHDHRLLVASADEPVRAMAEVRPRSIARIAPDAHIVDFGQNLAGRIRLNIAGLPTGARVVIRHAEVLDESRRLYTDNLRTAAATDVLISDGRPRIVFEPRFTYHGFRYAEIRGIRELSGTDIVAVALHSDTAWAGGFDCSDPDIRRLHDCVVWGQRSNFVSVPTDCPQRDERLGWLADAQVFLPTAALNADVAAFFTKWLRDVEDARDPEGGFSNVAPRLVGVADQGAPGWGDAGVIIPWQLYLVYGDSRFLARAFDGMRTWVDLIRKHNPDLVWRHRVGPHFSDWLAPGTPTPREVIATAYFARSAHLTARAADVLGHRDLAQAYHRLAADIRAAFREHFVTVEDAVGTPTVRVAGDTQTGYLVTLAFELLAPEGTGRTAHTRHREHTEAAARRLAELVEADGPRLQTGFLGVALAAPVLDAHGRADLAHALLCRTEAPSWLFPLRHGATTIWERWDGWTPETGFRAPSMNSFNHYALGSIGEWLYRGVAGLDQASDSTAYRHLSVRPVPGDLGHASAWHESVRGTVETAWTRYDDRIELCVRVPPGATADVRVPTTDPRSVRESDLDLRKAEHVTVLETAADHVVARVASGRYRFTAAHTPMGRRPGSTPFGRQRPPRIPSPAATPPAGPHQEETP